MCLGGASNGGYRAERPRDHKRGGLMSSDEATRAVHVSADLYDRIAERISSAGFDSVDEYVTFVLEEILKDEAEEAGPTFTKEEEEEVKKRLRALGYLD